MLVLLMLSTSPYRETYSGGSDEFKSREVTFSNLWITRHGHPQRHYLSAGYTDVNRNRRKNQLAGGFLQRSASHVCQFHAARHRRADDNNGCQFRQLRFAPRLLAGFWAIYLWRCQWRWCRRCRRHSLPGKLFVPKRPATQAIMDWQRQLRRRTQHRRPGLPCQLPIQEWRSALLLAVKQIFSCQIPGRASVSETRLCYFCLPRSTFCRFSFKESIQILLLVSHNRFFVSRFQLYSPRLQHPCALHVV